MDIIISELTRKIPQDLYNQFVAFGMGETNTEWEDVTAWLLKRKHIRIQILPQASTLCWIIRVIKNNQNMAPAIPYFRRSLAEKAALEKAIQLLANSYFTD